MTRAAFVLVAILLAGCGGGGGGPATLAANPFAGAWSGTWTDTTGERGTLTGAVASDGGFDGTIDNQTQGVRTGITGRVEPNGAMSARFRYPDGPQVTVSGTVSLSTTGRLLGSGRTFIDNQEYSGISFNLVRQ